MHLAIMICLVCLDNLYMYTTLFFENILIDLLFFRTETPPNIIPKTKPKWISKN